MEDNKPTTLDSEIAAVQGSGGILAAERKRQKKDIEYIAGELNLSLTQLKIIESDQIEGLPEPTYVRGYIRGYAKILGLNPDEVLKHYLNPSWQQSNSLNEIPKRIGSAEESRGRLFTKRRVLSFLLLSALLGILWFSGILPNYFGLTNNSKQGATLTNAVTPVDSDQPAVGTTVEDDSIAENTDTDDSTLDAENSQVADTSTGPANSADDTANSGAINELILTFSKTSWVDIRDAQDNRLAYKSYAKGEELKVDSETALSVFIGNAEGVTVEYNGAAYDISEYREGVYAKFSVGE